MKGGGDGSHAILVAPLIPPWRNSSSVFFVRHSALRSPLTPRLPSFAATKSPLYQCTETPASGSFARNIATMLVPRYPTNGRPDDRATAFHHNELFRGASTSKSQLWLLARTAVAEFD